MLAPQAAVVVVLLPRRDRILPPQVARIRQTVGIVVERTNIINGEEAGREVVVDVVLDLTLLPHHHFLGQTHLLTVVRGSSPPKRKQNEATVVIERIYRIRLTQVLEARGEVFQSPRDVGGIVRRDQGHRPIRLHRLEPERNRAKRRIADFTRERSIAAGHYSVSSRQN